MEWKCIDDVFPEYGRILVYSPIYKLADRGEMVYRVIDACDLKYLRDVKYWTYITNPEGNIDTY